MFSHLFSLLRIALSNITSSPLNFFVGLVLFFGAALLVVLASLFNTLDQSLSKSIIDSIAGHLQIYSAASKDSLELYGKVDGSDSNLAPIEDFKTLKAQLLSLPNVERVLPMGAATALISSGNIADVVLERLRTLYRNQKDAQAALTAEEFSKQSKNLLGHVHNIVKVLAEDIGRQAEMAVESIEEGDRDAIRKALQPDFWANFDEAPFERLEFLENDIAPLMADGDMLAIRYLGTDLDTYRTTFERMVIVEGNPVPPGKRGLLMPRFFYEEYLKLRNARRLDKIRDALATGRKLSDLEDKELQRFVRENKTQTREILLQLDDLRTQALVAKLQAYLHTQERTPSSLLADFFDVTDQNFDARYAYFYDEITPMLSLYKVHIGDRMTLKTLGRSGGNEAASLTMYGIFEYRGLEKSPLAGFTVLIDMVTFRDLYGFLTSEKQAEQERIKAQAGVKEVSREDAELELFSGAEALVAEVDDTRFGLAARQADMPTETTQTVAKERARRQSDTFDTAEIDDGVVLHAAIVLQDGAPIQQLKALQRIEQLLSKDKSPPNAAAITAARGLMDSNQVGRELRQALQLVVTKEEARAAGKSPAAMASLLELRRALKTERAGMEMQDVQTVKQLLESARPQVWVVNWSTASGFLGKMVDFFRLLLVGLVATFAFVALIIVTIGLTIATLQRTPTIGTMRAIGAQRAFIVGMVFIETAVLSLLFGLAGILVGAGVVKYLNVSGIPAWRDELYFFFSGPVLRPELTAESMLLALLVTVCVSILAVIVPTVMATRIAPITAIQKAA